MPPPNRKPSYPTLGAVIVCVLALAAYTMRRSPAKPDDTTVTASNITATSAMIAWTTDKPLASQVEYGTTPAYGSLSVFGSSPVTSHSVNLTGLTPGTTYNYAALSTDSSGRVSTSANFTFTTSGAANTASATGSTAIGGVAASAITSDSATITWTTSQPLMAQVEYGTTPAYGALSAFSSSPGMSHSVKVTGLMPGTTYNYAALSTNSSGQVTVSTNFTFTTASAPGTPAISGVTTSGITTNSATVNWNTDQPSASQVQFGTTTAYNTLSVFGSPLVMSHSIPLSGLIPGTTYDFSALSSNSSGQVGTSANFTFTTATGPPAIRQVTVNRTTGDSATIVWSTDQPSTSQVKYGIRSVLEKLLRRRTYDLLSARDSSLVTSHSVTLNGLIPGTTYNFVVMSANSQGMNSSSSGLKFATLAGTAKMETFGPGSAGTEETAFSDLSDPALAGRRDTLWQHVY